MSYLFESIEKRHIYVAYHNPIVVALIDSKGHPFMVLRNGKAICFYAFEEDIIPGEFAMKSMLFSDFVSFVKKSGFQYLDYYGDLKPLQWYWHLDAYSSFTKEALDPLLKAKGNEICLRYYDFLQAIRG